MQNLMNDLTKLFQKDDRIFADGKLLKNKLTELALKLDQPLIELLLSDNKAKEHFFIEKTVKKDKVLVFDKDKFIAFVNNKEFLPDSFTSFKNKIGLMSNGEYLKEKGDVVLAWAYKDCVLEGGQDKEDQKRDEVFYNETLSPDEVDRLFDPKVLTNFKRYNSKGGHAVTGFNTDDNLIVKGNNLLALHCLKNKYRGQVKLIYIDPPYNTGKDSFGYNDSFNHSSWLTFMKNRLEVASMYLAKEGLIFVHCDKNENAHLKLIMDEVFGRENYIDSITTVNNPRGRDYGGIANMHEFIHVYAMDKNEYVLYELERPNKEFDYKDEHGGFDIRELRNRNTRFNEDNRPNLVYPFYVDQKSENEDGFYKISLDSKKGWVEVYPAKSQGIQTVWRWGKDLSLKELNKNVCARQMEDGRYQIVEKYRKNTRMARSVWWDKEVNSELGTKHLRKLFGKKVFDYPKPETLMKRVLEMSTHKGDLVMDFCLGSGTTATTCMKLGRRYIGIEQMTYIKTVAVERLKKVIEGEDGGISKVANWKGGGSFVYAELKEWNEEYMRDIKEADTTRKLLNMYEKMKKEVFFRHDVDLSKFDEKEFEKLQLKEQKQILCECLEKNHLYVNLSEIDDATYKVSVDDKKLNKEFYKIVV
jgi:adenine-specific DNA-methyltransferase